MLNTPTLTLRTGPLSSTGRADPPRGSLAALSHMPEEVLALLVAEALQAVGALEVPLAFSCSSGVLALCRTLQPLGPSLRPPATGCCPLQSACFQVPGGLTPSMNPTGAWFSGVLENRQGALHRPHWRPQAAPWVHSHPSPCPLL